MEAAAMKSGQLLSIRIANTVVQPKTVGAIISQVMKMENRQHRRGGVDQPPNTSSGWRHTLPVLVSKLHNPEIICGDFDTEGNEGPHTLISGWTVYRTIKNTEEKRFVLSGGRVPDSTFYWRKSTMEVH